MILYSRRSFWAVLVAGLVVAAASPSSAQVPLQPANSDAAKQPRSKQAQANPDHQTGRAPAVAVQPSIPALPGLPAHQPFPPVFVAPFWNPALNNPWMNQFSVVPVPLNPLLANPNGRGMGPGFPFVPEITHRPAIAMQQPGFLQYQLPDLQVNPWSGTIYRPLSGTATLADGSIFHRVPGTGLLNPNGTYATGTGLYYNAEAGTFFNPRSGVISQPGKTNVYMPYVR